MTTPKFIALKPFARQDSRKHVGAVPAGRGHLTSAGTLSRIVARLLTLVTLVCNTAAIITAQETSAPAADATTPEASASPENAATTESGDAAVKATAAAGDSANPTISSDQHAEPKEIPFRSQPYLVSISIAFDGPAARAPFRERVLNDVRTAVKRMYGRMWTATVEPSAWLIPGSQSRLQRMTTEEMLPRYPEQDFHKAFLLTVECPGLSYRICCREFDSRIQELTPVYSEDTSDDRAIGGIAARLMRDAFRPAVMYVRQYVNEEGRGLMELQTQAGEILPPDPTAMQVTEGDVLRPFVRSMDRRDPTKLKQLQPLPLTYIRVMNVDRDVARGLVTGVFLSHAPVTMFGGKGRRLQHFAVRQRPTTDKSRVKLVLYTRRDKPLIAHRMAIAYQLDYKDQEDGPQTQLVSDRNGEIVIERRENHPTFWIRVYSGASLLARVPYAPGLLPYDVMELPDDIIRLRVEGELQLLQDELIDAIAVREVLVARANKAAEKGNREEVDRLFAEYAKIPSGDDFVTKISNIRIPAVKEAQARRQSERRIVQICQQLEETVQSFFTAEKRDARQEEMQKIRQTAEQNEGRSPAG
ncbi:MAG: hypothetical protein KDA89_10625 [Planctomycetaceae bacterium]|nr:hypothetical protein [Planctomycetaceae bacterium]